MLRRPFDLVEILLGLLAIAGISIVFHFDPRYKLGIIISLFSALLASIFPIMNREILQKMDVETATRYQLSGGFLFITLLMPVYLYYSRRKIIAFLIRLGLAVGTGHFMYGGSVRSLHESTSENPGVYREPIL
jgi:drug/metabolite transporter (DMT)-like permease